MTHGVEDPTAELSTASTGGRSARVIALAFVLVLTGVVYVGISGQDRQSVPTPNPSFVAEIATPSPERTLPHVDTIEAIRADPTAPIRYQYLGARLALGGHSTLAVLDAVADDEYSVAYRIPNRLVVSPANLNVSTVTDTVSHDDFDVLGEWSFALDTAGPASPTVVLDASQPPDQRTLANPTFSHVSRNGFRITVTSQNERGATVLTVNLRVAADAPKHQSQVTPNEDYEVAARIGGKTYRTDPASVQMEPGHFHGEILLPLELDAPSVALDLSGIPASDPLIGRVAFATHAVPVWRIADHSQVTEFTSAGGPSNPGLPQIAQLGYRLRVLWAFDGNARAVFWDLVVNPSHWVTGEDGLIGYPHAGPSTPMVITDR
jgi:hypothetical protein